MKIYTRRGDAGLTSLYKSKRKVSKDDQRIISYGTVDELNSSLGHALSFLTPKSKKTKKILLKIQEDLHKIASELATHPKFTPPFLVGKGKVEYLENIIDEYDTKLPPLTNFIFPGGSKAGSCLHLSRSIARRLEREVVKLNQKEKLNPNLLKYLNRLSDCLFILARAVNLQEGAKENIWRGRK